MAYRALTSRCRGRVVLDAGCGEGYGCAAVGQVASAVLGVDYDAPALRRARARHAGGAYARANLVALPLADACVDVVLSLQVVEHIWSPDELLAETARVLPPGGLLALSTPNRETFSPGLGRRQRPANPFHVREFDATELADLVAQHLDVVDVGGVHAGPRLRELDRRFGSLVHAQLAGPPETWSAALVEAVVSVTADDFEVRPGDADGALDLLVLAVAR
ncbi:MAG TPA: class I SAM-dependent methyltransferase [Angustibacter sp.]|nr:class I SAM-dependent methyltransferase [Angustibacter sp.]